MKIKNLYSTHKLLALASLCLLLSSCATSPNKRNNTETANRDVSHSSVYKVGDDKGLAIAEIAESMVGVNYRYGGHDPDKGFDCSGLVFYSHTQVGEQVPRVSYAQLAASDKIDTDDLQPGDLLFYRINGKPSHVGIYIGNGQFVHAPSSGKKVRISSIDNVYFKPRLIRAGRLYQDLYQEQNSDNNND